MRPQGFVLSPFYPQTIPRFYLAVHVGGLTAVLWTDAIQTIILVVGASVLGGIGQSLQKTHILYCLDNEIYCWSINFL